MIDHLVKEVQFVEPHSDRICLTSLSQ